MNWKFWQKEIKRHESPNGKEHLPPPTTIPEPIARYMVVDLKEEAEWVWQLKAVERPVYGAEIHEFKARVYEESRVSSANIKVHNYKSFDKHPDLIVLQATYNRKSGDVQQESAADRHLKAA